MTIKYIYLKFVFLSTLKNKYFKLCILIIESLSISNTNLLYFPNENSKIKVNNNLKVSEFIHTEISAKVNSRTSRTLNLLRITKFIKNQKYSISFGKLNFDLII